VLPGRGPRTVTCPLTSMPSPRFCRKGRFVALVCLLVGWLVAEGLVLRHSLKKNREREIMPAVGCLIS
jgi:hypothetical protein